jgi:hypothetical protein
MKFRVDAKGHCFAKMGLKPEASGASLMFPVTFAPGTSLNPNQVDNTCRPSRVPSLSGVGWQGQALLRLYHTASIAIGHRNPA